jgi:hypothetical protein
MFGGSTPAAIAARLNALAHNWVADGPAERAERARRKLLSAIASREPATLNQIAAHRRSAAQSMRWSAPALSSGLRILTIAAALRFA